MMLNYAVKVFPGGTDHGAVIARFEYERDAKRYAAWESVDGVWDNSLIKVVLVEDEAERVLTDAKRRVREAMEAAKLLGVSVVGIYSITEEVYHD